MKIAKPRRLPKPYYEDEFAVLYNCDCFDILTRLSADHLITDPPYSAQTHRLHKQTRTAKPDGGKRLDLNFESISEASLRRLLTTVNVYRWAVMTLDDVLAASLRLDTPDYWRFARFGAWLKPGSIPQMSGNKPAMGWEPVVVLHHTGSKMRWRGGGRDAVWRYPVRHGAHPTEKPLPLYRSFVGLFTDPGETILDPFAGSGTTLVAAKGLGRYSIGIEIDPKFCEMIAQRLTTTTSTRTRDTDGRREADARARGFRGLMD